MCDYCGCHSQTAIAELSEEHDRIQDLCYDLRRLDASDDEPAARRLVDERLAPLLLHHTDKEERGLFAELRSCWEADDRLDTLIDEHRDIEAQLQRVRAGGTGWQQAVRQLVTEISQHILDEEVDLFPYALYELRPRQWESLDELHEALATTPEPNLTG